MFCNDMPMTVANGKVLIECLAILIDCLNHNVVTFLISQIFYRFKNAFAR